MIQISKYNKQHPLRVFEAFAGYGSQSLAFKYLKEKHPEFDFKVVGFSEIEFSAVQAYHLLHGRDIPNFGNIARIDWNEVPDFDFISWSSPCQDFSNAGLRKGAEEGSGTRSSLIFQERRMLEAKHPKYVMEYVDYKHRLYRRNAWGHPWVKIARSFEELFYNLRQANFAYIWKMLTRRIRKLMGIEKHK